MSKKLSKINLNLLNILDVLLSEKNISQAARKLYTSQPAISYSLKQLRDFFNDELLIKKSSSNYMQLTPLGNSLIKPVSEAVNKIENIFEMNEFDPLTSRRQIKIATTDYMLKFIISRLLRELDIEAPNMTLSISNIIYPNPEEQIIREDIDIGIGIFNLKTKQDDFRYEYLFSERLGCYADKDHPAFQNNKITLEDYYSYPHICSMFPKNGWTTTLENSLYNTSIIPKNTKNIIIHNTNETFCLLPKTNYISIGGERLLKQYGEIYNLSFKPLPFKIDEVTFSLCTHKYKNNDKAVEWMINKIKKIAGSIDEL